MRNVFKDGTLFYRIAVTACLAVLSFNSIQQTKRVDELDKSINSVRSKVDTVHLQVDSVNFRLDTLENLHPWKYDKKAFKRKLSSVISESSYFNFVVWTPVDTAISEDLRKALSSYTGPVVKINSLRRYGSGSKHCHGKAADLELTHVLVEYLLTDEGQQWLNEHKLEFYIEGKPGSRRVKKYKTDPRTDDYVFFNPKATGDHIHIFRA